MPVIQYGSNKQDYHEHEHEVTAVVVISQIDR